MWGSLLMGWYLWCGGDGDGIGGDMGGVDGGGDTVTADCGDEGGDGEDDADASLLDLLKSSGFVLKFSGSSENKIIDITTIIRIDYNFINILLPLSERSSLFLSTQPYFTGFYI